MALLASKNFSDMILSTKALEKNICKYKQVFLG